MSFNLFDFSTYNDEIPNGDLYFENEPIINSETNKPITILEFVNFIKALDIFLSSRNLNNHITKDGIKGILVRLKNKPKNKPKSIPFIYQFPESNKKFHPEHPETYCNATDNLFIWNKIYYSVTESSVPSTEKEFVEWIRNYCSTQLNPEVNYDNMTLEDAIQKRLKTLKRFYSIAKPSDLVINNYRFTEAQKCMVSECNNQQLKIIVELKQKFTKKYEFRSALFDNFIPVDNYLFSDLMYMYNYSVKTEQSIVFDYFTSFDAISSEQEIDILLNNDYLNYYSALKSKIKKQLLKIIN